MPTSIFAGIFYYQTCEQLLAQTLSHLQQETKSQGMMLYSQLLTLTSDLDRVAAALPQDGPVTETIVPPELHKAMGRRFQEIRVLKIESGQPGLTPPQIAHLQAGKSLLEIHHLSEHQPQLTLSRLVNPRRLEAGLLSAYLDETALWGRERLSANTDLAVEDGAGQPIYSTFQQSVTLPDFRGQDSGTQLGKQPLWNIGGRDHVVGIWSIPLQHMFLMDPWVIVLSQTRESALLSVEQVRLTFLWIIALTLCAVVILGLLMVRHSLQALLQLREGIARVASGNFSTQVTVHHRDEFEEVAASFNGMAENLNRQFQRQESISSIGQAFLAIHEPAAMARIVLSCIPKTISCDATGLILLDPDDAGPTILSMQFRSEQSDALTTSHCQVTAPHREMLEANPDHTLLTSSSLPTFLTAMRRTDLSVFAILPIVVTDQVSGVLVLGYRQKKKPPADDLGYARRVANLIAAVLPNSRTIHAHMQAQLDLVHAVDATQLTKERSTLLQPTNQALDEKEERLRSQQSALLSLLRDCRVCEGSLPVVAQQITTIVAQALAVHFVGIWVYEEETQSLNCLDHYDKTTDEHTYGRKLLRMHYPNYMAALDRRSIIAAAHTFQESAFLDLLSESPTPVQGGARLDVPFQTQNKLAGVVSLEQMGSSREWASDEQQFAQAIANFMTLILEAARQRESKETLVNTQLTPKDVTRAQAELLTNMSHKIRTPLNGVIGMTEILAHTPLTDTQRQYVNTIYNSGTTLLTLISDILDGSEIGTGKLEVHPIPINLRDLVENIVEQLAERAQRKGLQIQTVYDPSVPTAVMSDPLRIRQIMTTLLSNAIKFTQAGEVTVSVTQEPPTSDQEDIARIKLAVEDTGSGISVERQPNLFQSFSQVDRTTTHQPGDTGLGLSRCKQLSEVMGGAIGVESTRGKGSTFWVVLPFLLQSDTPAPAQSDSSFSNLCLCAAVSSSSTRHLLAQYLSPWGISPQMADSEGEFLECIMTGLATERGPVVAVIDEHFDNMTDTQIIQTLLSDPMLQSVKIIRLVSLIRRTEFEQDAASVHMHDVTKPIRFHALHQALRAALNDQPTIWEQAESSPTKMTASKHILIGEDNLVNQEIALLMLQSMGYTVTVAQNGREVVSHAKRTACDLILMDCQMPEMDGFEATKQIREWEQQESRPPIPIIALTAHANPGDREQCLAMGMSDYISKPFTRAQLQTILTSWLPLNPMIENHESLALNPPDRITSIPTASDPAPDLESSLIVDQNAWKSITSLQRPGKPDTLAKILSLYLADSHTLVTTLRQGMADGNTQVVNHAAHSLRSRSAMLGAISLSKRCRQLEELSRQEQLKEAEPLLAPLIEAFDHASQIFQAELKRRSA